MLRIGVILPTLAFLAGALLPGQGTLSTPVTPLGATGQDLILQVWKAQKGVAFQGKRLYFFDFGRGKRVQEERIAVKPDGKGGVAFHLELTGILDSHTRNGSPTNLTLVQALFSLREGANFRFRGFRIHDLDLALRNYDFFVQGTELVAGRPCRVLQVIPKSRDRRAWKIWVDSQTGLLLKYLEFSLQGKAVSGMEMQASDLKIGKGLSFRDVRRWWKPSRNSRVFASLGDAERYFGAKALVPSYLPSGYMLMEIRVTRDSRKRPFLVLIYTDGIDTFSVIQGKPAGGGKAGKEPPVVHRYMLGCVTQLWADIRNRMLMLVGRMDPEEVPLVFQSMF